MSLATISPAPSRKFSQNPFVTFYQSSIGKKTHVVATLQLAQQNRVAKSTKYAVAGYQRSTLASRTMVVTLGLNNLKLSESISRGGFILAWLVFAGFAVIPIVILLGFLK
jgi:hypothetical protein